MARVRLLSKQDASPEAQDIYRKIESNIGGILNVHKAAALAPTVGPTFLKLGNCFLSKIELNPLYRELAIFRTGAVTGCDYLRNVHVPIALQVGLSQAKIDDIGDWKKSKAYDTKDRAALQYIDEVAGSAEVSDAAFKGVQAFLSERAIVELTLAVGYYRMIARFLVALKVEVDAGPPPTPDQLLGKKK